MGKLKYGGRNIDGGWAWVVLTTTYIGMLLHCIPLFMNGVLYMALLDKFHEGEAKTSLTGALSSGLLCFAAPVGGAINNKYSCRVSIILGGVFSTVGFALSAFVPTLDWIILTAGVLVGIGYSIQSSGFICVIGFYFDKWRDTVISGAFIMVAIAMLTSAPIGINLVSTYGLNATFLILACMLAHVCVCGMLSKPSSVEIEILAQKERDRIKTSKSKSKTYLDLTLMKNVSYACFLCSISAWNFALCVAIMHLPYYVYTLGGSGSDIGLLMTSFSIANFTGRLLGSYAISKLHEKSLYVYTTVLGLNGIVTSFFMLYAELQGGSYVFAIQLGLFTGLPNTMMTPISLSFVGVHKMSEAYVLSYLFCGIGVTSGPVLIGYLYGATGSYIYSFVVAGLVLCMGCLFAGLSICCKSRSTGDGEMIEIIVQEKESINKHLVTDDNENIDAKQININSDNSDTELKMRENKIIVRENGFTTDTPHRGTKRFVDAKTVGITDDHIDNDSEAAQLMLHNEQMKNSNNQFSV